MAFVSFIISLSGFLLQTVRETVKIPWWIFKILPPGRICSLKRKETCCCCSLVAGWSLQDVSVVKGRCCLPLLAWGWWVHFLSLEDSHQISFQVSSSPLASLQERSWPSCDCDHLCMLVPCSSSSLAKGPSMMGLWLHQKRQHVWCRCGVQMVCEKVTPVLLHSTWSFKGKPVVYLMRC